MSLPTVKLWTNSSFSPYETLLAKSLKKEWGWGHALTDRGFSRFFLCRRRRQIDLLTAGKGLFFSLCTCYAMSVKISVVRETENSTEFFYAEEVDTSSHREFSCCGSYGDFGQRICQKRYQIHSVPRHLLSAKGYLSRGTRVRPDDWLLL